MFTKPIIAFILAVLMTYTPYTLADSLWSKLKNRVQNEVENVVTGKVARKAGDEAGEATDAVLNPEPSNNSDSKQSQPTQDKTAPKSDNQTASANRQTSPTLGGLSGMLESLQQEVPIDDDYVFDLTMTMEITSDNDTNTMEQAFSENAMMMNVDEKQSIIMDLQKEAMIMINKTQKTKSAMSTDFIKKMAKMGGGIGHKKSQNSTSIDTLKRTGKTKRILGYNTEQWVYDDGERNGEMWMTNDIDFDFIGFATRMGKLFGGNQNPNFVDFSALKGDYPTGIMLETVTYLNGKKETHAKTIELINKPSTMNLKPYATRSMMDGMGSY